MSNFEDTFLKHRKLLREHFMLTENAEYEGKLDKLIKHLKDKRKVLILTTSNRWVGDKQKPKSSVLAEYVAEEIGNAEVIDVSKLKIYDCEGNVSKNEGNNCGVKEAALKDKTKNPTGDHRCWCSYNNKDDELWKISKVLFESDAIVFFGSVRWGQTNGVYQRLIERLTWLENRHSTLNEDNIIKDKEAGVVFIGQNWNGETVAETQKNVLKFFGFKVPDELSFNWQYLTDPKDESQDSYKKAPSAFEEAFDVEIKK
jgi:multimeric flavodoxin WrbA